MRDGARRALPNGVGLGLRWEFLEQVLDGPALEEVAFFEVSPENYMRRGGYYPAALERLGRRYPLVTHELLPLPFTRDAALRVADRLDALALTLGRPVAIENITYYARMGRAELDEADFLALLFERCSAGFLLDVNNVYVNAQNHGFDARRLLERFPLERTVEIHVAGHSRSSSGLILDTHGAPVIAPVEQLLAWALERTGPVPVLLERDNDVPELATLLAEVRALTAVYDAATARAGAARPERKEGPRAIGA